MANKFDHLTATERASVAPTPDTGDWRVYFKSDGLYVVDDAGVETGPLGSGGGGAVAAADVSVADVGGYYVGTDVEAVLQELGVQLLPYSGAKVTRGTSQSAANGTWTNITWTAEAWDDGGWVDLATDATKLVVPSGVGKVDIKFSASFAHSTAGRRLVRIFKNGASTSVRLDQHPVQVAGGPTIMVAVAEEAVIAGDFFQLGVFQDSGASMLVAADSCWASIKRIDD